MASSGRQAKRAADKKAKKAEKKAEKAAARVEAEVTQASVEALEAPIEAPITDATIEPVEAPGCATPETPVEAAVETFAYPTVLPTFATEVFDAPAMITPPATPETLKSVVFTQTTTPPRGPFTFDATPLPTDEFTEKPQVCTDPTRKIATPRKKQVKPFLSPSSIDSQENVPELVVAVAQDTELEELKMKVKGLEEKLEGQSEMMKTQAGMLKDQAAMITELNTMLAATLMLFADAKAAPEKAAPEEAALEEATPEKERKKSFFSRVKAAIKDTEMHPRLSQVLFPQGDDTHGAPGVVKAGRGGNGGGFCSVM